MDVEFLDLKAGGYITNSFIQATKAVTYNAVLGVWDRFNSILDLKNVTQRMGRMDGYI